MIITSAAISAAVLASPWLAAKRTKISVHDIRVVPARQMLSEHMFPHIEFSRAQVPGYLPADKIRMHITDKGKTKYALDAAQLQRFDAWRVSTAVNALGNRPNVNPARAIQYVQKHGLVPISLDSYVEWLLAKGATIVRPYGVYAFDLVIEIRHQSSRRIARFARKVFGKLLRSEMGRFRHSIRSISNSASEVRVNDVFEGVYCPILARKVFKNTPLGAVTPGELSELTVSRMDDDSYRQYHVGPDAWDGTMKFVALMKSVGAVNRACQKKFLTDGMPHKPFFTPADLLDLVIVPLSTVTLQDPSRFAECFGF